MVVEYDRDFMTREVPRKSQNLSEASKMACVAVEDAIAEMDRGPRHTEGYHYAQTVQCQRSESRADDCAQSGA